MTYQRQRPIETFQGHEARCILAKAGNFPMVIAKPGYEPITECFCGARTVGMPGKPLGWITPGSPAQWNQSAAERLR